MHPYRNISKFLNLPIISFNMENKHGRPIGSEVRQNIVDILHAIKHLHGYEIYKLYIELFPQVTMRLIYYHLKKGLSIEEFKILRVDKKKGNFSWGSETQHIIYQLGSAAKPRDNPRIKEYVDKHLKNKII